MANKNHIIVKNVSIRTIIKEGFDYICITDIAKQKNSIDPNAVISNWMRNRNTVEFLGLWETLNNPNFNPLEFEGFRKVAGQNAFTLSPLNMTLLAISLHFLEPEIITVYVPQFRIHSLKNGSSTSYSFVRITYPTFIKRLMLLKDVLLAT